MALGIIAYHTVSFGYHYVSLHARIHVTNSISNQHHNKKTLNKGKESITMSR